MGCGITGIDRDLGSPHDSSMVANPFYFEVVIGPAVDSYSVKFTCIQTSRQELSLGRSFYPVGRANDQKIPARPIATAFIFTTDMKLAKQHYIHLPWGSAECPYLFGCLFSSDFGVFFVSFLCVSLSTDDITTRARRKANMALPVATVPLTAAVDLHDFQVFLPSHWCGGQSSWGGARLWGVWPAFLGVARLPEVWLGFLKCAQPSWGRASQYVFDVYMHVRNSTSGCIT